MNQIVYEYLNKTNNNPHKAYDEYIKYHLLSGRQFPEDVKGIKDFIKASKPEEKKKKTTYRKPSQITEYKMTIEEVVEELKHNIRNYTQYQHEAKNHSDAMNYWSTVQTWKIMLCHITGQEYIGEDMPN